MPFPSPDPNRSIERFSTPITVYPLASDGHVGDSVYTMDQFGEPFTINASVRPDTDDPKGFRVLMDGQTNDGGERLLCAVPKADADRVEIDASIDYDGRAWRAAEREYASLSGFVRYLLLPDSRRSHGETAAES